MTLSSRPAFSAITAAFVIATIILFLGTPQAQACSCLAPDPGRDLGFSNAAFIGELVDVVPIGESEFGTVNAFTFTVMEWVKADLGETVTVTSTGDSASCGLVGRVGDVMGILTGPSETGQLSTGLCQTVNPDMLTGFVDEGDPTTTVPPITVEELDEPIPEPPPDGPPFFEEPSVPPEALPQTPRPSESPDPTGGISPFAVIGGLLGFGGVSLYLLDRHRKVADDKDIW
ncbi:hypothetical protein BMS3Bbin02_01163 [bacterium BMS3Bbin02]|nr:hypothetical protein BMS3Bbin02_01163 [bacterium BMS3Bbin02]